MDFKLVTRVEFNKQFSFLYYIPYNQLILAMDSLYYQIMEEFPTLNSWLHQYVHRRDFP